MYVSKKSTSAADTENRGLVCRWDTLCWEVSISLEPKGP